LQADQPTVTGQVLGAGVGIRACLEALRTHWQTARAEVKQFNGRNGAKLRRGVGVAGMWYGCGNTSLPNPSTIRAGLKADGRLSLHQGAVDIGQGSNTVVTQIFADALGAPLESIDLISADTDLTPDCGKTSASRQTFVTGKAAELAAQALRAAILHAANAGDDARCACRRRGDRPSGATTGGRVIALVAGCAGYVLAGEATSTRRPDSMPTARAVPMRSMGSARIWPRSRSISSLARSG
jgi:CO/xanthine dehydrogenase Mo-binding subunit